MGLVLETGGGIYKEYKIAAATFLNGIWREYVGYHPGLRKLCFTMAMKLVRRASVVVSIGDSAGTY